MKKTGCLDRHPSAESGFVHSAEWTTLRGGGRSVVEQRVDRRLAAIVSTDVVAYTRLMERDEVGTHARLKARYVEGLCMAGLPE
jgi:class 3 adenylate cyclase